MKLLLDTGVLGQVCHPRKYSDVRAWALRAALAHDILVPEVADYELRRELIRIGAHRSLDHLNELERELRYVPISTAIWHHAAQLWAMQRRRGRPTANHASLDCDVLLAAQALAEGGTVITFNTRHFTGVVEALTWQQVPMVD
ncbi:MAG: PIN domain-containing protein [Proteobacteria bacterium]|nr:PIN domain-containing protein [Pseudomonadota bacterium]